VGRTLWWEDGYAFYNVQYIYILRVSIWMSVERVIPYL
jgi:hypothetical protein